MNPNKCARNEANNKPPMFPKTIVCIKSNEFLPAANSNIPTTLL